MLRRLLAAAVGAVLCLAPAVAAETSTADTASTQTVVLILDTSGSMQGARLAAAIDASRRFIDIVPDHYPVALVSFAATARVRVQPTTDRVAVLTAIDKITANGDTALFDAVVKGLKLTGGAQACTVLILGDGEDTSSRLAKSDALAALRASACTVNTVAFRASAKTFKTMQDLAAARDGRAYTAYDAAGIASIFEQSIATPTATPTATDTATVSPTASPTTATPGPSPSAATSLGIPTSVLLLLLGLVTASGLFAFIMLALQGSNRSQRRRVEKLIASYAVRRAHRDEEAPATFLETVEDLMRPLLARKGRAEKLTVMLDGASVNRSPEQWTLIRGGIGIGLAVLILYATGNPMVGLLLGVPAGAALPQVWLGMRRSGRARKFEEGLPDALMLMASSLRSGFALDQAIVAASEQATNEVSEELRRAVQEIRIGVPLEDALERVALRIDSDDFKWVVTALRIQRRSGGNLAELLVTVSKTVRQRGEVAREVKALTAEGRMSSYVLMALPIGMFAFLMVSQPDYLRPLWETPTGWMLSGGALGMLLIGWLLMQKMVKVDV